MLLNACSDVQEGATDIYYTQRFYVECFAVMGFRCENARQWELQRQPYKRVVCGWHFVHDVIDPRMSGL